jgi:Myb-like DNA-binding domain
MGLQVTDAVRNQPEVGGDGSKAHPFSMAEERRLKRGVKMFGYNWKVILSSMKFSSNRTAVELRNKWRTMVSSHDVPCDINSSG